MKHTPRSEPDSTAFPSRGGLTARVTMPPRKTAKRYDRRGIRTLNGHTWSGRVYQGAGVIRG